jgi:hypothetical protein
MMGRGKKRKKRTLEIRKKEKKKKDFLFLKNSEISFQSSSE